MAPAPPAGAIFMPGEFAISFALRDVSTWLRRQQPDLPAWRAHARLLIGKKGPPFAAGSSGRTTNLPQRWRSSGCSSQRPAFLVSDFASSKLQRRHLHRHCPQAACVEDAIVGPELSSREGRNDPEGERSDFHGYHGRVLLLVRFHEGLLNAAATLSHPAYSISACLANVLGGQRALLYKLENLLAFLAICRCGLTYCALHIGSHRLAFFRHADQLSPHRFDLFQCGLKISRHSLSRDRADPR